MNVKQDPKGNVNALPPPQNSPSAAAEHQRKYRAKVQRELQAFRQIRQIIADLDGES